MWRDVYLISTSLGSIDGSADNGVQTLLHKARERRAIMPSVRIANQWTNALRKLTIFFLVQHTVRSLHGTLSTMGSQVSPAWGPVPVRVSPRAPPSWMDPYKHMSYRISYGEERGKICLTSKILSQQYWSWVQTSGAAVATATRAAMERRVVKRENMFGS